MASELAQRIVQVMLDTGFNLGNDISRLVAYDIIDRELARAGFVLRIEGPTPDSLPTTDPAESR